MAFALGIVSKTQTEIDAVVMAEYALSPINTLIEQIITDLSNTVKDTIRNNQFVCTLQANLPGVIIPSVLESIQTLINLDPATEIPLQMIPADAVAADVIYVNNQDASIADIVNKAVQGNIGKAVASAILTDCINPKFASYQELSDKTQIAIAEAVQKIFASAINKAVGGV